MYEPNVVKSLDDITSVNRTFSIIAMDQRNTLRRMFTAVDRKRTDEELRQAKVDVARELTPMASGLLSDPAFGVPAINAADALAPTCGLLVAAEPAERRTYNGEPRVADCVEVCNEIIEDCRTQGIPAVIENLVWREEVSLDGPERHEFLSTVATARLEKLIEVADRYARPWR